MANLKGMAFGLLINEAVIVTTSFAFYLQYFVNQFVTKLQFVLI